MRRRRRTCAPSQIRHGHLTFVRPPSIGGAGAFYSTSRALQFAIWGDIVAGAALVCLGLPCLAWLAGGVLAFAALPVWSAIAAGGLASLTALPLLPARSDPSLAQVHAAEPAGLSGAGAPTPVGAER